MTTRTTTPKTRRWWTGAALALSVAMGLSACGGASAGDGAGKVNLVGFSVLEKANDTVIADFEKTDAGKDASFTTSYGASGDQSRAVAKGLKADVVHFSLEGDVTRLVDEGKVASDWNAGEHKGIATQSVVVLVVRKGNPKKIEGWDDLVRPGVGVITPNPGSSGSARWNILAAWAHATQGGAKPDSAGQGFLTSLLKNVVALPGSGREATSAFENGNGDVLLSYENEAILARANGADIDYVVPDDTLLIENPAAVTKDANSTAKAFLQYVLSKDGQRDYASFGYRPLVDVGDVEVKGANDPTDAFPDPGTLWTIEKNFGGWTDTATKFFDDESGLVTKLLAESGKQ